MKKFLMIILGALFVMSFAASAFAIHAEIPSETAAVVAKGTTQITLGGEIRFRGEFKQNTADFNDDRADHSAAYDGRVRLSLLAEVTKNTKGFVHLETGMATNGSTTNTSDVWTWGTGGSETAGVYQNGNGKRGTLAVLEAWIQHTGSGLLGIPAGIKVGHMPLALGNKLFFDHTKFGDDAIVFFMDPTPELHIGLLTVKFAENTALSPDDANAYVGLFNYKISKDAGISGDITYVDHQNSFGAAGVDAHLWNFGLRGNANISGLGIMADAEVQTGKVTDTGASDPKFRGYALMAGLSYKMDPVTLSLDWAYGSGDDWNDTDNKIDTFITAVSGVQKYTYVYDYRAATSRGATNTGIANTWYVKLGANADLAKDLNGLVNIYYLRAPEAVAIAGVTPTKADGSDKISKDLGVEVDAKITYKIDRNLTYWVEGGILFADDAYDVGTGVAGANISSDNAYAVRNGISLSF